MSWMMGQAVFARDSDNEQKLIFKYLSRHVQILLIYFYDKEEHLKDKSSSEPHPGSMNLHFDFILIYSGYHSH